jgi:hypothetical protein
VSARRETSSADATRQTHSDARVVQPSLTARRTVVGLNEQARDEVMPASARSEHPSMNSLEVA